MAKLKIPPIDKLYPVNCTAVILHLEGKGYSQEQVEKWFEINNAEHIIECKLYYAYRNAGRGNPLQMPIDEIDPTVIKLLCQVVKHTR